jgi:uncharacterized protein (TIGR02246 family)
MGIFMRTASRTTRQTSMLSALVLIILALAGTAARANSTEEASRVVDRWAAAYSAHDAPGVLNLYAADAILFGTARPLVFDGTKPIAAAFTRLAESADTVRICWRQALVVGQDSVLVTGSYEFQTIEYGMRESIRDRFTMLVVKHEGDWRISYHTTSHSQPGPDSWTGRTAAAGGQTGALPIAADAGQPGSFDACRR